MVDLLKKCMYMNTPSAAKFTGSALILTGLAGYYLTGAASITALIPAFLGLLIGIFGYMAATRPLAKKHFMHGAALVALLGIIGTATAIPALFQVIGGADTGNNAAVISRSVTAVICIVFLAITVKSFIDARKEQKIA